MGDWHAASTDVTVMAGLECSRRGRRSRISTKNLSAAVAATVAAVGSGMAAATAGAAAGSSYFYYPNNYPGHATPHYGPWHHLNWVHAWGNAYHVAGYCRSGVCSSILAAPSAWAVEPGLGSTWLYAKTSTFGYNPTYLEGVDGWGTNG
jgi:hypothetical protein